MNSLITSALITSALITLSGVGFIACDLNARGAEEPESRAGVSHEGLCGELNALDGPYLLAPESGAVTDSAAQVKLELGYDRPFSSAQTRADESAPLSLPIEYGLQGGHHVDISLRFVGDLDPDRVDLSIELELDASSRDLSRDLSWGLSWGRHDTEAWYLLFPQDSEPTGCYFHRARVFLFNETNDALQSSEVSELDDKLALLTLKLTSQRVVYQWQIRGRLRDAVDDL